MLLFTDFSADANEVAEREAILAAAYYEEQHIAHSAEIIGVTAREYRVLEARANERGECPCISCLAGEGDRLCVSCHFRYATCGEQCTKCYAYESNCQLLDEAAREVNERGLRYGVEDAWSKFNAELDEEDEARETVNEWRDARGRVVAAW